MFKSIVVGTDGSETAARAIMRARDLAAGTPCKVHVVSAYNDQEPRDGDPTIDLDPRGRIDEVLDSAGTLLDGIDVHMHACTGDPVTALLDVADKHQADVILVGNRGMNRRLLGSVPNSVSHKARCDVLIVSTT